MNIRPRTRSRTSRQRGRMRREFRTVRPLISKCESMFYTLSQHAVNFKWYVYNVGFVSPAKVVPCSVQGPGATLFPRYSISNVLHSRSILFITTYLYSNIHSKYMPVCVREKLTCTIPFFLFPSPTRRTCLCRLLVPFRLLLSQPITL